MAETSMDLAEESRADFAFAMEDVLDVYKRPYDPLRPVVCLDEATKQLVADVTPALPMKPGQPAREDYEYERRGTANLFMQFEPLAGRRIVKTTERRTNTDFAEVLHDLAEIHYPNAEKIVLVMDNLSTHKLSVLYQVYEPAEARRLCQRFEPHYTPKHASWLNIAECELSVVARQCLNQRIESREMLANEITHWQNERNAQVVRVDWQFAASDARVKLKSLYPQLVPIEQNRTMH